MNFLRDQIERFQYWLEGLSEAQRQLFLAALLLIGAALFSVIIYFVFFRSLFTSNEANTNENANTDIPVDQLPDIVENLNRQGIDPNTAIGLPGIDVIAEGGNTLSQTIYDQNALDPVLSADGNTLQFYDPETGQFYKLDENGNLVLLSEKKFPGVEQVNWSNSGGAAVLELADGFNIAYDFTRDQQYTLNEDMDDFDFSPNDNQISFKYNADIETDRWLGVSNLDGSGVVGVERLGPNGDKVNAQWSPSGQSIGTYEENISSDAKNVYILGFRGENFENLTVQGRGFDYQWTPNGQQMVYSTYDPGDDYNSQLFIVDAYGDSIGNNNIPLNLKTSVDKCTFNTAGNAMYCAVPVDPPIGGGIEPEILNEVQHDVYRVDLTNGISTKLATPIDAQTGSFTQAPSQMFVTSDESVLYYTEAGTGEVRRLLLR